MSSISSVGGNQGLYQFIQSLTGASSPQAASPALSNTAEPASGTTAATQAVPSGRHRHHVEGAEAFKRIQDTVTNVLQSAQSSGSKANPNHIIEEAISKILKGLGSSSSKPGAVTVLPNPVVQSDPAGDGTGGSAVPVASIANSAQQSFFKTLQSLGVTPQQFHADFLAAIKNAQGGQVNAATAFQSVPVGATLDTVG